MIEMVDNEVGGDGGDKGKEAVMVMGVGVDGDDNGRQKVVRVMITVKIGVDNGRERVI